MEHLKVIAMIPARYGSSRFPGKMLAPLGGKPVIVRTCEAAASMGIFDEVYVVTDDERIRRAVTDAGIRCLMSIREHETGSDRIAEAVEHVDCDIVVNIQGDEPFTRRDTIEKVLAPFYGKDGERIDLCTLKELMTEQDDIDNPNNVKVITDIDDFAVYFSRNPIPYPRDKKAGAMYFRHIGIYAFRKEALMMFSGWPMRQNEASEKIECLRFIEYGRKIKVVETSGMKVSIDTPEDLAKAEEILKGRG
ncbi:MAG TPA: 3-deoxy-manno-octulosonate cytidylyltransferase [Candidatus Coprenecus pullistercoris]|nr:3-deoxy-manno-octulosonate cytidylyltransferase [Candidatus Coprenecus pullistercoris]